jgi:hypothetical protein
MDGGRILKSVKKSYSEYIGVEKMGDVVRQMMKDQHKGMLIALRDGQFDQLLEDADSKSSSLVPQPAPQKTASHPAVHPPPLPKKASLPPPPAEPAKGEDARKGAGHPTPKPPARPPSWRPPSARPGPVRAPSAPPPRAALADEAPPTARMPPEAIAAEMDADETIDDFEPAFEPESDLPPPPANMFRPKEPGSGGGGYRTLTPVPEEPVHRRSSKAPPLSTRSPRPAQGPSRSPARPPGKPGESPKPALASGKSTGRAPAPVQAQTSRAPTGGQKQAGASNARPHQRQVARRGHPQLPGRGSGVAPRRSQEEAVTADAAVSSLTFPIDDPCDSRGRDPHSGCVIGSGVRASPRRGTVSP